MPQAGFNTHYKYRFKEFDVSQVSDANFVRTLSIVFGTIAVAFVVMIAIARMLVY